MDALHSLALVVYYGCFGVPRKTTGAQLIKYAAENGSVLADGTYSIDVLKAGNDIEKIGKDYESQYLYLEDKCRELANTPLKTYYERFKKEMKRKADIMRVFADESFEKNIRFLEDCADFGDVDCALKVGAAYYYGEYGLKMDVSKAEEMYRKAAHSASLPGDYVADGFEKMVEVRPKDYFYLIL